jgi:hypothetical protein
MPIETFWKLTFYHVNQPNYMHCNPRTAKEANECAYNFGEFLYINNAWKTYDGAVFTVEVERVNPKKAKVEEVEEMEVEQLEPTVMAEDSGYP